MLNVCHLVSWITIMSYRLAINITSSKHISYKICKFTSTRVALNLYFMYVYLCAKRPGYYHYVIEPSHHQGRSSLTRKYLHNNSMNFDVLRVKNAYRQFDAIHDAKQRSTNIDIIREVHWRSIVDAAMDDGGTFGWLKFYQNIFGMRYAKKTLFHSWHVCSESEYLRFADVCQLVQYAMVWLILLLRVTLYFNARNFCLFREKIGDEVVI